MPGQNPSAFSPDPGVVDRNRNEALYGGDPQSAMMAVLRQMGYNPFRTNSFVQSMLGMAPGLRNAWDLSNIGAKTDDIDANGGIGAMFSQFLRSQLQGGNVFGTLATARQNMPNYANQMRSLEDQLNNGLDPSQIPVFMDSLDTRLNNPNAFAQLYGSLATPALGALGKSFQNTLGASTFSADQNRVQAPSFGTPQEPTFFDWIMGKR